MGVRRSTLLLSIVMLAALRVHAQSAPGLPAPLATRQQQFSIPFRIVPPRTPTQEPVEAQLHASTDLGATWKLQGKVDPRQGKFTVRVPEDGEYWFAVRTLDRAGNLRPERPLAPELRVVVDTRPPVVRLRANRIDGELVDVEYEVTDANVRPENLRISYSTGSDQPWIALNSPLSEGNQQAPAVGRTSIAGDRAVGELRIRAEAMDVAGNPAANIFVVPAATENMVAKRAISTGRSTNRSAAMLTGDRRSNWSPDRRDSVESHRDSLPQVMVRAKETAWHDESVEEVPAPVPENEGGTAGENDGWPRIISGSLVSEDVNVPETTEIDAAADVMDSPLPAMNDQRMRGPIGPAIINNSTLAGDGWSNSPDAPAGFDTRRVRLVNSLGFELDYELEATGAAGIANVELWMTADSGRTWNRWTTDEDRKSPVKVRVSEPGLYGFTVVVESGTGLRGRPPEPGDEPEVWLGIDLTPPRVRLTSVAVGSGAETGDVTIQWEAADEHLSSQPISLSYGAVPDGPWSLIATSIDNQGRFVWRLDDRVPDEFYVRVEAVDDAGNVGRQVIDRPISVNRARPKAHIRDVRPVRESNRGKEYRFFH